LTFGAMRRPGARVRGGAALFGVLALCACAYDPPIAADRGSPAVQADLKACRQAGDAQGAQEVAKRAYKWFLTPVFLPAEQHRAIRACLQAKGYALRNG
jgi:hypothetical protein